MNNEELFELILSAIDLLLMVKSGGVSKNQIEEGTNAIIKTSEGRYKDVSKMLKYFLILELPEMG